MNYLNVALSLFTPEILGLILLGVVMGIIFGAIPGLNTPIAIALVLPFTYSMDVLPSMALILGIYMGGISGGLITAILLKIPGTVSSVATTLDGYPMAQSGRAAEALAIGTFSSFVGGILSCIALMFISPLLSKVALAFGAWEYFGAAFLALSFVCVLMDGKVVKGFISVFIGLLLSTVGVSPIDGSVFRFTFGNMSLSAGFDMIAVILGAFALPEMFRTAGKIREQVIPTKFRKRWFYLPRLEDIKGEVVNFVRSAVIGIFVGILPGMGPSAAGMVAYSQAKKSSKHPEKFGTGCVSGLVASETSNNAVTGGALIPMLVLSIPGDTSTAVILGALMIQGITCGPLLVINSPDLFKAVVVIAVLANIFMFVVQSSTIRLTSKIIQVPRYLLLPLIVVFCTVGAFTINNRVFDLYAVLLFAVLGYILEENDYPLMPMVLAFVLGNMTEYNFRRTIMYYGSIGQAFTSFSVGTVLVGLGIILLVSGVIRDIPAVAAKRAARKAAKAQKAAVVENAETPAEADNTSEN